MTLFSTKAIAAATLSLGLTLFDGAHVDHALAQTAPLMAGTTAADAMTGIATFGTTIYAVGFTFGSLDGPNLGNSDVFVRKYGEEGDILWGRQFGTNLVDGLIGIPRNGLAVATDTAGNVYVAGTTLGSLAGSRGGVDAFLRKYNKNGQVVWTRQFGTALEEFLKAVAVDPSGNIYVVGDTAGSLQGPSNGFQDCFVRKYNPNGTVLWTRQFGTSQVEFCSTVATDRNGNVFVAGVTNGTLAGTALGNFDAFVRKYNPNGAVLWTKQFGSSGFETVSGVATDSTGAVIIVGSTNGALPGFSNFGGNDGFVRKYNTNGIAVRTDQFGTSASDAAYAVAVDPTNNFYVTGDTAGGLGGANVGSTDVFVRKYTASNAVVWTRQFGTTVVDEGRAIAAATAGKIYVAGSTAGTLVGANQGSSDAYLRRLSQSGFAVWTDQ